MVSMDDLIAFDQDLGEELGNALRWTLRYDRNEPLFSVDLEDLCRLKHSHLTFREQNWAEAENNEQEEVIEPVPIPERKPVQTAEQRTRQPKLAPKEKRSKVLDAGFDANEALSMLINIQSSQDDKKFDLLDGFLDKYKVYDICYNWYVTIDMIHIIWAF